MGDSQRSENVYGERIDRCMYNGLMKVLGGVAGGIVFSTVFFKRRAWPVILGGGFGIGLGVSSCQYEFKYRLIPLQPHKALSPQNYASTLVSDGMSRNAKPSISLLSSWIGATLPKPKPDECSYEHTSQDNSEDETENENMSDEENSTEDGNFPDDENFQDDESFSDDENLQGDGNS